MIFKHQSGTSLLEVLISVSLLISGALTYFQLDARLIGANHLAMQKSEATHLLQQRMDLLAQTGKVGDSGKETIALNSQSYDIDWWIEDSSFGKAININIDWKDHKGKFSEHTHLESAGYYAQIDTLTLSLLPPPTPIRP